MALRIRHDGTVLCAAMHPAFPGDVYVHDGVSYELTVEHRLLVTEPMFAGARGGHATHGQWWWRNEVPSDVTVEEWS
jgi:hypothetical protein